VKADATVCWLTGEAALVVDMVNHPWQLPAKGMAERFPGFGANVTRYVPDPARMGASGRSRTWLEEVVGHDEVRGDEAGHTIHANCEIYCGPRVECPFDNHVIA
jgi:hypothetical protein